MFPLGLLYAQDVRLLRKPLITFLAWTERQWDRVRLKWQGFRKAMMNNPKAETTDNNAKLGRD